MTATGLDVQRRAWRRAVLRAGGVLVLLLCCPAFAQLVQLAPGPELQPRLLPRLYLRFERPSEDFPPTVLVSQALAADAGPAPQGFDGTSAPTAEIAPHAEPRAGCGCAGCQSGAAHSFPGYDKLGYTLHGECPPLVISEQWCRRPLFVDVFAGAISGDEFIDDQIGQSTSILVGGRLGWDFNGDWGCEGRLAFAEVETFNFPGPSERRQADLFMWDVSIVHYFGSSLETRPYCSVGLGAVDWEYIDVLGDPADEKMIGVPVALGVKQRCDDWLVFRLDLTDNIAFGGGSPLGTQHNFSVTGNVELRFGGPRTSYWAWAPRRHYSW